MCKILSADTSIFYGHPQRRVYEDTRPSNRKTRPTLLTISQVSFFRTTPKRHPSASSCKTKMIRQHQFQIKTQTIALWTQESPQHVITITTLPLRTFTSKLVCSAKTKQVTITHLWLSLSSFPTYKLPPNKWIPKTIPVMITDKVKANCPNKTPLKLRHLHSPKKGLTKAQANYWPRKLKTIAAIIERGLIWLNTNVREKARQIWLKANCIIWVVTMAADIRSTRGERTPIWVVRTFSLCLQLQWRQALLRSKGSLNLQISKSKFRCSACLVQMERQVQWL